MQRTTIYYDGACPLCRAEIAQYARQDTACALDLVDASDPAATLPPELDRDTALGRFHVTAADGRLLSGAEAFVEVWRRLPGWQALARVARLPGATPAMEGLYRAFLHLRPGVVRAFVMVQRLRRGRA